MNGMTNDSTLDTAIAVAGGYTMLTILVPVMILFLVLMTFSMLISLTSISDKLTRLIDIIEESRNLIPEMSESASLIPDSEGGQDVETSQRGNSTQAVILGVVLGGILILIGFSVDDNLWTKVLYAAGITSVVTSIVFPLGEKFFKKKSDANDYIEENERELAESSTSIDSTD